jgi:uncharacterized membrane protein YbhN (UPF0104 family)
VFLGVGLGILYFVYLKYNAAYLEQCELDGIARADCNLIQKIKDDFMSANFFWIFMVLIAFTISNLSRALRWKMLIKPLGYIPRLSNAFLCIIIGYFANMFLPRIGEVARAATMSRYEKIPTEKLLGTIVVGRVVDVICFAAAIGLTVLLEYDTILNYLSANKSSGEPSGNFLTSPIFYVLLAMGGLVLVLVIFRRQLAQTKLYGKVVNFVQGLWEGIKTVRELDRPWLFILHSVNIWVMYYFMTYLCFFAFEPTSGLSPMAAMMAFVFGAFGILIPSPGGMGTYHFFTTEALVIYGMQQADAFSFANILFFSIQLGCNIFIGLLSVMLLPWLNRRYEPVGIQH